MRSGLIALSMIISHTSVWAQYKPSITSLYSYTGLKVGRDASVEQVIEERARIETERGIELYGERKITYNAALEKVDVVEAYSVHPDGTRVDVPPEKIRTQDDNSEDEGIYSDRKAKVIIFSNLAVGSEVYYRATAVQHTPDFEGHFFWSRHFTPHMRYENLVVDLAHDPAISIQFNTKGMEGGRHMTPDADGLLRYRFSFKQLQAFPPERDRAALSDFAPHFSASSFQSYEALAKAYQSKALIKAQPTPAIVELARSLTKNAQSPKAKVQALYNWVSRHIRYLGIYVGDGGYVPHAAQEVLDNRYGDCKDHVVLLEALLRAIGIESSPALINSSEAYTLPSLPLPRAFDHVITYVPQLNLFLDSTARFSPMGTLPDGDMQKPVLLTATGEVSATPSYHPNTDYTLTRVHLKVQKDGRIEGNAKTYLRGVFEVESRANEFAVLHVEPAAHIDKLLAKHHETGTGAISRPDPSDLETAWHLESRYRLDPTVNVPGPAAMPIPLGLTPGKIRSFAMYPPTRNRKFPLGCASSRHTEVFLVEFPSGMKIRRTPKNIDFKAPHLRYQAIYKLHGQTLEVKRVMERQRTHALCQPMDDQEQEKLVEVVRRDLRQQIFID